MIIAIKMNKIQSKTAYIQSPAGFLINPEFLKTNSVACANSNVLDEVANFYLNLGLPKVVKKVLQIFVSMVIF
jgi:hypothetical protein